jgi:hypothetical protein
LQAVFPNKAATTMKFSIVLFALLSTAPTYVQALNLRSNINGNSGKNSVDADVDADVTLNGPIETCGMQALCLGFTIKLLGIGLDGCNLVEQVVDTLTGVVSNPFETVDTVDTVDIFEICMELKLGGNCAKGISDSVSHTCAKVEKDGECSDDILGFKTAVETKGIVNGYKSCQTVKGGGTAEFLLKDGNGVCGQTSMSLGDVGLGAEVTCGKLEDLDGNGSCTGNKDKECVWTIQAPTSTATTGTDDTEEEKKESVVISSASVSGDDTDTTAAERAAQEAADAAAQEAADAAAQEAATKAQEAADADKYLCE